VLKVAAAGGRQGSLDVRRPLRVGLCEPPDLVGCQSQVAKHTAERLAGIDGVQKLLPYLGREPRRCPGSAEIDEIGGLALS
jgi:hypothetical protein